MEWKSRVVDDWEVLYVEERLKGEAVVLVEMGLRQWRNDSCSVLEVMRRGRLESWDSAAVSFCWELEKTAP